MEASFHRHDWSNHWPSEILNLQLLSLSQRLGVELKFPTFQSNDWFPGNQPPSLGTFPKSPHWHKLRCGWKGLLRVSSYSYGPYYLENSEGALCQEWEWKPCVFLIVGHNITGPRHILPMCQAAVPLIPTVFTHQSSNSHAADIPILQTRKLKHRDVKILVYCQKMPGTE